MGDKVSKQQKQSTDWRKQLLELVHSTSLATDFRSVLTILLEDASRLVQSDGISVIWLESDHLEVLASSGSTAPLQGLTLPASQMGAARAVLDSGRAVAVTNTAEDARWRPVPGEEQACAWLGVPLLVEGRILGLMEWTDRQTARFDEEQIEVARELARQVAPILHQAQLLDDTRQRLRELVEPHLTTSPQPVDVGAELRPVVQEASDFTNARHAFIFLLGDGSDHLRCVAAWGDRRERLRSMALRGDGTLAGWGIPMSHSSDGFGAGPSDRETMATQGIERALVLPLRVGGEQVGMLGVAEPRNSRGFGQDAIRLMTHLASQASLIVERTYRRRPETTRYDYEMVLQSSPLGVGVLTVTGDIRVCNPALAGLLSRSNQSLAGRNLSEFLVPSDGRRLLHALEELGITGQRRQVDVRVQFAQGEYRHTRMSLAFAHISDDAGGNVVAIVEDVSPLKILEEERVEHLRELREKHALLRELDQLKSRFVSNVSHELRTPLAVIKLYATLARKGRPEKQTYYLQTIEQETHRLETMVENILDLTRLDRHTLSIHQELLSTEEIVSQVLEVYVETARKRDIELTNRVRDDIPPLWADKNHFIQMLTNLLDNALKYTPRGGEVWVAARETGSNAQRRLEIAVGDGGVGIPEDEQERVFDRFYRGSNNTPGSTGTGLGLAIVQDLMSQHGGTVTLESKVGEGSIFALQFPLHPPDTGD
jgi:PAS domain S-box-containing protein